jgi:hypothetical protein
MLIDLNEKIEKKQVLEGSVVIIGAGISGIFLAYLLRAFNKKIIVIEKGELPNQKSENLIFTQKKRGKIFNKSFYISNKFFGGWSNYWGGLLAEMRKEDFKKKYWGLKYSQLKILYDEVYKIFDMNLNKNFNNDLLLKNTISENIKKYLCFYLPETNFYNYFNKFIKNDKNVYFYYNCKIKNVITKDNKIQKLELVNSSNKYFLVNADLFVLSMGVQGNNQLLLSLKENNPSLLKEHKKIGSYLHDHIGIDVGSVKITNLRKFRLFFENGFLQKIKYQPKLINVNKNLSISGQFEDHSNFTSQISELKKLIRNLLNTNFSKVLKSQFSLKNIILLIKFYFHYIFNKRILNFFGDDIRLRIQSEQTVLNSSFCKIDKNVKQNSNYLKKLKMNWTINNKDFNQIINFTHMVDNYLKQHGLGKIDYFNLNYSFFKKNIESTYHLSGGTIISKDIKKGVCNSSFKIWGVKNLFVTGSSLFPCSGSANVTLTILALTLKLSKILTSKLKR